MVGGFNVVDPVAKAQSFQSPIPVQEVVKETPKPAALSGPALVVDRLQKALPGYTVQADLEHPRGAAVLVFGAADQTRPVALVVPGTDWEDKHLELRIGGFLQAKPLEEIQKVAREVFGISPARTSTFIRR